MVNLIHLTRTLSACCLCLIASPVMGIDPQPASEEEARHVRRIAHLWKDRDLSAAQNEIQRFLEAYPESEFASRFQVILGDIAMEEGAYDRALEHYDPIADSDQQQAILVHRLEALVRTGKLDDAIDLLPSLEEFAPGDARAAFWVAELQRKRGEWASAEEWYGRVEDSFFQRRVLLGLTEVYEKTDRPLQAARAYLTLADSWEAKREQLLYKAAELQLQTDPEEALETLHQVLQLGGELQGVVAWKELLLLLDLKRYQDLIDRREEFQAALDADKKVILSYFLARSYVSVGSDEEALPEVQRFIADGAEHSSYHQSALLLGIALAGRLKDVEQSAEWTRTFEKLYAKEPEVAKAWFLHALALKNTEHREESLTIMRRLASDFPTFTQLDDLYFELGALLYDMEKWQQSRATFLEFVHRFSYSPLLDKGYQYIIYASLRAFQSAEPEQRQQLVEQIRDDIAEAFNNAAKLTTGDRARYQLHLARAYYDLKQYGKARELLTSFLQEYQDSPWTYQVHYLLAHCSYEQKEDLKGYISHAEQALALKDHFPRRETLKHGILTAYLHLANQLPNGPQYDRQREAFLDKAAELIHSVSPTDRDRMEGSKLLWAATYFAQKAGQDDDEVVTQAIHNDRKKEMALRAIALYEAAILGKQEVAAINLTRDSLYIERGLYRLASLYGMLGRFDDQISVLERLRDAQKAHPTWPWTRADRTLFALSYAYALKGQVKRALSSYESLIGSRRIGGSAVAARARLQWARLAYQDTPKPERTLDAKRVGQVVKVLRGLQARRVLQQEPVHLEAAIDWAVMRATMATGEDRDKRLLDELLRVKEEFSQRNDVWAKDYHAAREKDPDKDRIYQAYMLLIDGFITQLQAGTQASERRLAAAKKILSTLQTGNYAVSPYVKRLAELGIQAMEHQASPVEKLEELWQLEAQE